MMASASLTAFTAAYETATAARIKAEADLIVAIFAHDAKAVKIARRKLNAAIVRWNRAGEALRHHRRGQQMTMCG